MTDYSNMYIYMKYGCPYCYKVDLFLEKHGIEIEHRFVEEPQNYVDLLNIGGKVQSPCLIIDGEPLYESDDIIRYFKKHLES